MTYRVRGIRFRDEDDAYEYFMQRDLDTELTFDESLHEYRLDGAVVPSVTAIIKPLTIEGGSEATRDHKRQIGKALDAAIQITESGLTIDPNTLDSDVVPFLQAWLKFKHESGFRALLNQRQVFSRKLRFAGTLDLIGTRKPAGFVADELIDTKCVWTMDPATAIQTAGYKIAAEETFGLTKLKRGGVQLLRDGTFRYFPYNDPLDEQVFKCCLTLHSWKRLHR